MAGTIYLSEKESSLRHFKDLFSKIRGFRFVDNARGSFGMERCARQLVGRVRLCFHQLFIVQGTKKGRSVRKGRSFRTWEGFEDDKRPQLAATCATAARCSPLSLSLSPCARVLSAYSETSFVVKLEGPRAVTYADTLRVIREPPWFLPYLDSTCSFRGF